MDNFTRRTAPRGLRSGLAILGGMLLLIVVLAAVGSNPVAVHADPIDPPEGYPKLSLSVKTVTPTLATTGGMTLHYTLEIRNTGAYTAAGVMLADDIPVSTTYNGDAQASVPPTPTVTGGTLAWVGDVGFDATVIVSFSVTVSPTFTGKVINTAVISHPLIARPVTKTAETVVTNDPILAIEKTSFPLKPGPGKPFFYTIVVANQGQPTADLPITVTDRVPLSTTVRDVGPDGISGTVGSDVVVTWTRRISLQLGETTAFTFSVDVDDVPAGTVITNADYQVVSPKSGVTVGDPYTVTIVDPEFLLAKYIRPDPPGANREMTYILTLLNAGSLATDLVITDRVPAGAGDYLRYVGGGIENSGVVSWTLPSLDTGESAEFTFTVYISDVMGIPIVNDDYVVCSAEEVCQRGEVLTSVVQGPTLEVFAILNPIAKKPGGGTGPVTPTLVVRNLGPGNALDATALLKFVRISVSNADDLEAIPPIGTFFDAPDCGTDCFAYAWTGDLAYGAAVSLTTNIQKGTRGRNTIGGEEGTIYTTTVVVTDSLGDMTTQPVTATATGKVTHYANLIPTKSAPPVIGRGQLLTYTITVWNSALATDEPPSPVLTDVVPTSTTLVYVSDGGVSYALTDSTFVSWTLPAMSPGDVLYRLFSVRVNDDLISGTKIVNLDYGVTWYETETSTVFANAGQPVTTTVREVGLNDSYKEVTPTLALPGPGNVLTYYLHIVNSSALSLTGVTVYDQLPWESSTYRRDAVATAGLVVSDIVSIRWQGNLDPLSSEVVTITVLVDPYYQGPVTNTAVISHPNLLSEVVVHAVAYITERPELRITKSASPDPVNAGDPLAYTIRVANLGQQATQLVITDVVPANTSYIVGSATAGGQFVGDQVRWEVPVLKPGEIRTFGFQVTVRSVSKVTNDRYAVRCVEGVVDVGTPVITRVGRRPTYLPLVLRKAP